MEQPLCEIELELKQGQVNDLFEIAYYFINHLPIKLGLLSKAARGYHLAQGTKLSAKNLESIDYSEPSSLEPEMINILNYAIEFIQHNELVFSQDKRPKSHRRIMDGVSLIIQALEIFKPYLPDSRCQLFIEQFKRVRKQARWIEPFYQLEKLRSRKSPYRKDIEKSEHLLTLLSSRVPSENKIEAAIESFRGTEFNRLLLSFIQWISSRGWRNEMSLEHLANLSLPLKPIAEQCLDDIWQALKVEITNLDIHADNKSLEKVYWALAAGLLNGVAISGLFHDDTRMAFRGHLLNLLHGIEEAILLNKLQKLLGDEAVQAPHSEALEDINANFKWINSKRQSLTMALTASMDAVLKLKPYW